jgi:LDH2 family malate/lactate/ureidoglycolate dehydrogenase
VKSLSEDVLIKADPLRAYCTDLFVSQEMPREDAHIIADSLVEANLTGVDSHGVSRMGIYIKRLQEKMVNTKAQIKLISDYPAAAAIDGLNSMGAPISVQAMEIAIAKARTTGCAFVTINNSNHNGTAAYFARKALAHDMIGFSCTNAPSTMPPWGGITPFFGTNPFAVAIPADKQLPIVMDMATSVVARGKIILAGKNGKEIPLGWAISKDGEMTTDPKTALEGAVLPFGEYKGSAIALLVDVLSGILSGAAFGPHIASLYENFTDPQNVGHAFGVIDISKFGPADKFKQRIDQMILEMKALRPAKGVDQIKLPGEIEHFTRERRLTEGIPLSRPVLKELKELGTLCGVPYTLE